MARYLLGGKYEGMTMAFGSFQFRDGVCVIPDNRTDLLTAMENMYVRFHGVRRDAEEVIVKETVDVARERRRMQLEAMPLNEARGVARPYHKMAANMKKAEVIKVVLAREFPHVDTADIDQTKDDAESGDGGFSERGLTTITPVDENGVAHAPTTGPMRVGDAAIAPAPPTPL